MNFWVEKISHANQKNPAILVTKTIPTTLITGLLGSGKSTLIQHLISLKPSHENWAILINEFGEVDIDGKVLNLQTAKQSKVVIKTVTGGCICCTAQIALTQSINEILQQHGQINRLIIEPTGLGHPAKIIDTLIQNKFYQPIQLLPSTCLVTPMQLTPERWQKSSVMRDLVTLADNIIINKTDLASKAEQQSCKELLAQLYPPKDTIIETQFAQANLKQVFVQNKQTCFKLLSAVKANESSFNSHLTSTEQSYPSSLHTLACYTHSTSTALKQSNTGDIEDNEPNSIGWIWPKSTQFKRTQLKLFFSKIQPHLVRAKGILKTGNEWQLVQWADGKCQFSDIAWRKDSRLELFFEETDSGLNIDSIEAELMLTIYKY